MSNLPRKILFLSSEVAPFSKTGGLADVSSALPWALARLGCDVRVLTPRYGFINPARFGLVRDESVANIIVNLRGRALRAGFSRRGGGAGEPTIYFLECDPLYDRPGVYVDPFTNRDYIDNDYRYILLSRAALALCATLDWEPEILHCNDWQTGPAAFYLHQARERGELPGTRSLLTIHNIAYHGLFGADTVARIGEGAEKYYFPGGPLEFYSHVNFLKMGLEFADVLNTVSPTYAREIQSSYEFGYGLESVLRARGGVAGILNGIDVDIWNPAADRFLVREYTADSLGRKEENKRALCRRVALPYDADTPLIGMISRIVAQKGIELIVPVFEEILATPARMVMLGTGDPHYERRFQEFAQVHPDRFYVRIGYDEDLAHQIEAGVDLFLMPSKYEPCGLNQMMSMRYGTLPLVRATGGLADTVIDADADLARGTGFSFVPYLPEALLSTVQRATAAFADRPRWRTLQRNAMSKDFSWDHSARAYLELYATCLQNEERTLA